MVYENRLPPEGINVSQEHPLKEFFILTVGLGAIVVILALLLSMLASYLVRFIPFETEQRLSERVFQSSRVALPVLDDHQKRIQVYLQTLADNLSQAQHLPAGMVVSVHYIDDERVNAFATLGGHIVMFRGLLEKLPHENALAMVMAHEIAHIKHRDPLVAVGRGLTVALALSSIAGFADSAITQQLFGQVGLITGLTFNRDQEREADKEALDTLKQYYGHVLGAHSLFEVLQSESADSVVPVFLSTHPFTDERVAAVKAYGEGLAAEGGLTDLPDYLRK